jgi:branched-subunit amino acid transport protein
MSDVEALIAIAGLTAITVVTRAFFLLSSREFTLPGWVQRGLRYAPLAALSAVVAPEILMSRGHLIDNWTDARALAALAAALTFFWRRSILGTILSGMTVLLALRLGLGW